ncbi:reverse transcriptase domain-containing protein [Tanacetum coccineum]
MRLPQKLLPCFVYEILILGIDFMAVPVFTSRGSSIILVAVGYLSIWVEAKALPTNAARVVANFWKISLRPDLVLPWQSISVRGNIFVMSCLQGHAELWSDSRLSTAYQHKQVGKWIEVDINKKTENQAKMTKLSMEWKRLCKIKAKVQKCQSQSQYRRISSQTGAGTEEYYWMQS